MIYSVKRKNHLNITYVSYTVEVNINHIKGDTVFMNRNNKNYLQVKSRNNQVI